MGKRRAGRATPPDAAEPDDPDLTSPQAVKRTFLALVTACAFLAAGNSVIFALLPKLQDKYGFSDAGLGLVAAAGFGMSFIVQLLVAPLADKGHARTLLVIGALCSIGGNLLCAVSGGLWSIVAARALIGAAPGCFTPTARALVSSLGEKGRSERLGRMASVEIVGFMAGPLIGGALVVPLDTRWPFVFFCAFGAIVAVISFTTRVPALESRGDSGRIAIDLLRQRPMVVAVLLSAALGLPIGMYDALWARYLSDLGAASWLVGVSLACYSVPFLLAAGPAGRVADRVGPLRTALRAMFFITPLTISYSLFKNPWIPILVGITESVVQAAATPAAQTVVANASPPGRAASGQGLAGATNVLVMALVAIVSAWLYGAFGVRTTFIAVATLAAAVAFAAHLVSLPLRRTGVLEPTLQAVPVDGSANRDEPPLGAVEPAVLESGL